MATGNGDVEVGVAHGRFQIFHTDHLRYALAAKDRCKHLLVGITSPDPGIASVEAAAPHRSRRESNPLTYYERLLMITACLREAGVPDAEFSIVPFPIEVPQRLENYAPRDARYFLTVNDAWGDEKVRRLAGLGLNVDVLWRDENKAISGTMIRALMTSGGDWHHLVPPATAEFIERHGLAQRVAAQSVTG